MNPTIVTVVLVTILLMQMVTSFDYCQSNLNCPANTKHIGCGSTDNLGANCTANRAELVPMTPELIGYLLKKHNQGRCDIANGKISGFSTANQMIEMTWNGELAKLAEYNVKTCNYGHDGCRNTATYKYAGQNIAKFGSQPDYYDNVEAIDLMFGRWFDEYKDCSMTYINKYGDPTNGATIGHFTAIVSAAANQVGCALIKYETTFKYFYLVCNYSFTNFPGRAVYQTGAPASACTKGGSATYPGLCNSAEVIPFP